MIPCKNMNFIVNRYELKLVNVNIYAMSDKNKVTFFTILSINILKNAYFSNDKLLIRK
jgi:hypothetical protein